MSERIPFEGYLTEQLALARATQNRRQLAFLKDLVGRVARGQREGWLTQTTAALPASGQSQGLEAQWLKQADILAELFAKPLGQSRDQYKDSLPRFEPQTESYKGRYDTVLLVQVSQGRLTLAKMLEIQGVANYLSNLRDLKDWQEDPQEFRIPKTPYATYLHDGSRNLKRAPSTVRASLAPDERGGTVFDGLALVAQNPDVLKQHFLDLPGSQYGSGSVPFLIWWVGRARLYYFWDGDASPDCGSVVAGRKIVTR